MAERFGEAQSDSELKGLERIGWFVSHTRSAPQMTSRESEIFDRHFPGSGRVTLLIKPERFQPTRFVFSVRKPDGNTPLRDAQHAVILPLPGRASSAAPVQSIPAPDRKEILRRQSSPERRPDADRSDMEVRQSLPERPIDTEPKISLQPPADTTVLKEAPKLPSEPLPAPENIRQRRSEHLRTSIAQEEWRTEASARRRVNASAKPANMSLALVLVVASLLGCVAGYWAYLQLPPPVIALHVEQLPSAVLVRWPAEQTRGTNLAAIRIDDGQAMPLTEQQKNSGQIQISPTSDNIKIELISHHALRDSRGIIRYLRPETGGAPAGEGQSPTGTSPKPPGEQQ
jgi:hypothetical protein